jgi:hypothetical protein
MFIRCLFSPIRCGQGFAAAAVASGLAAVGPSLLTRIAGVVRRGDDDRGAARQSSTMTTTPVRTRTA